MDKAVTETLQILRLRAELLAILRGPDADREIQRWLLLRRTIATNPANAAGVTVAKPVETQSSANASDAIDKADKRVRTIWDR